MLVTQGVGVGAVVVVVGTTVGVLVGGTGVLVGGTGVLVGGTGVLVGGTGVLVGGIGVLVGGTGVLVGGTGVLVGGTGVLVAGTGVAGSVVAGGPGGNTVYCPLSLILSTAESKVSSTLSPATVTMPIAPMTTRASNIAYSTMPWPFTGLP